MHSTLNVWRQLIAVVRCLVAPRPSDHWCNEVLWDAIGGDADNVEFGEEAPTTHERETTPVVCTVEAHGRTWRTGPPPHVGWWNASVCPLEPYEPDAWCWWDGKRWSLYRSKYLWAHEKINYRLMEVWWNDYYPDNAAVPRMTPEQWKERARASNQ